MSNSASFEDFRAALRLLGNGSSALAPLQASLIDTPLGSMLAIAGEEGVHLLAFADTFQLMPQVVRLSKRLKRPVVEGRSEVIVSMARELEDYFEGKLQTFSTAFHLAGTPFQLSVWRALQTVPYGKTCSYADLAERIGIPSAHRAVANANAANSICIAIPCHRVIRSNGDLGGYGGFVYRKEWLLAHEKAFGLKGAESSLQSIALQE